MIASACKCASIHKKQIYIYIYIFSQVSEKQYLCTNTTSLFPSRLSQHFPPTSHTKIWMFSLYARLAHLIISNPPRQFPNNVPFIPCTLQSAIYLPVSITVFFSHPFSPSVYLPLCLHFLYSEEGLSTCPMFSLPDLHCVYQTHCLSISLSWCLTATPVC